MQFDLSHKPLFDSGEAVLDIQDDSGVTSIDVMKREAKYAIKITSRMLEKLDEYVLVLINEWSW
jgi:hypothetical protein